MNTTGLQLKSTSNKQFQARTGSASVKKSGGLRSQTLSVLVDSYAGTSISNGIDFKSNPLSDGFVLDGYFLGTFEFDSLTGHPGIRY
jgi:hypothetical protein